MKFYKKFLSLTRGKQIAVLVCGLHLFALFSLLTHHLATHRSKPAKPMLVRTILPTEATPIHPAPKQPPSKIPPASPKPKPAPPPRKQAPSKPKPPTPPKKESIVHQEDRIFKEIAERLETLNTETKRSRSALQLPSAVAHTPLKPSEATPPPTYGEFLIAYLQDTLALPEFGDVKVKLEVDRFGKLIDCQILEAKSVKNAEFLKNRLPDLTFPCLNEFGIFESTETFTITFRNAENH